MANESESFAQRAPRSRQTHPPERESVGHHPTTVVDVGRTCNQAKCRQGICSYGTDSGAPETHRDIEDAYVGRILRMRNVITPIRSGFLPVGQRQRRHISVGGKGLLQQRRPAAERQRECITGWIGRYPIRKDAHGSKTGGHRDSGKCAKKSAS